MRHLDLFSGIGGFALAAERVWPGCEHIFCEIDPFCQDVLEKHWPHSPQYGDIRELTKARYTRDFGDPGVIDLLTGGFPCQPFSSAGKRRGTADDRHLWPEMLRVIRDFHPRWIIGENVGGFVTWNGGMVLEQVHADLESEGYSVQAFVIPACALNAPHRRDRVWIVAHAERGDARGATRSIQSPQGPQRLQERHDVGQPGQSDQVRDAAHPISTRTGSEHRPASNEGRSTSQDRTASLRQGNGEAGTSGIDPTNSDAPDTTSKRGRPRRPEREGQQRDTASISANSNAPDPASDRRERGGQGATSEEGLQPRPGDAGELAWRSQGSHWDEAWPQVAARLCRVDDGLPRRVDRTKRLKALGNAIVPQVAAEIMRAIPMET